MPVWILRSQKGRVFASAHRVLLEVATHLAAEGGARRAGRAHGVVPVMVDQLPCQTALEQPRRVRLHVVRVVWRRFDLYDWPAARERDSDEYEYGGVEPFFYGL